MKCIGCYYYRSISQGCNRNDYCCHYLIDTGQLRKIPPEECYMHIGTPYLKKKRPSRKWGKKSFHLRERITEKMTIEQELRALREFHHMTQVQLADKAGISVTTLRKMERGERVKLDVLELIAEALGKKVTVTLI